MAAGPRWSCSAALQGDTWRPLPMSLPSLLMSIAAKAFALAILVGAVFSCPSGAEILRVDRIEIEVPDGGMTQPRPARSILTFKHRLLDLTMVVEVERAIDYISWRRG